MLGNGAAGRDASGFVQFAKAYIDAEPSDTPRDWGRYGFERYQDFALYSAGDWYAGLKYPIMVAECETNPKELLGELAGLVAVRCPMKYLFIHPSDTLTRLNDYCDKYASLATDWAETTYHVVEIPDSPSPPSTWVTYRAEVEETGARMRFAQLVG